MPKYKLTKGIELEHEGVRYYPNDIVELTDQQAEYHGIAHSLVEDKKTKHGDIGLALTRGEKGDSRQP
jgi:hypothetical protein